MAGRNSAARQPVLADMNDDDNAAFEAMRDEPGDTGDAGATDAAAAAELAAARKPAGDTAAATAEPAKPGKATDGAAAAAGEGDDKKTVPLSALHEERERRKELQTQLTSMNQRFDAMLARLGQPAAAATEQKPAEKPKPLEIPDPEKDALGALKAIAAAVPELIADKTRAATTTAEQTEQNRIRGAIITQAAKHEDEFVQTNPDYHDASAHVMQVRARELELLGLNRQQIGQQIAAEAIQLANACLQRGLNVAEQVYKLAVIRGYTKKAAAAAAADAGAGAVAEAAAAAEVPSAQARIDNASRGQAASRSLSQAAGGAPKPAMTAEKVAKMSDAEFAVWLSKATPAQQREVMGA